MESNHSLGRAAAAAILMTLMVAAVLPAATDEPVYLGRKLSYWMKVIRDRNEGMISQAFDAIRSMGPEARAAAPDLTALVAAPFDPIRVGKDSHKAIAAKLYEIELRAEAIDALASIGESAAPATVVLIRWALAPRVIPDAVTSRDDEELFIELIIMDTEERMRVIGAIPAFGRDAAPILAGLLNSPETPRRKLGVAILSDGTLPIAAALLRSTKCEDRSLGLIILKDMDLVVTRSYLDWLQSRIACEAN